MESLIDIDVEPSNYNHHHLNNVESPIDLLLGGSGDDEAALRGCPVLVPDAYQLPGAPVSLEAADDLLETSGTALISIANVSYRTAGNVGETHHNTNATIPHMQLIGAETTIQPAPLSTPTPDPILTLRDTTQVAHINVPRGNHVQANFIIAHNPDTAHGVVEAIHKEIIRGDNDHGLEIRQTGQGSYLCITAPAKNITEIISVVHDVADELIIDDSAQGTCVFQEPPLMVNSGSQVVLDINPRSGDVRPRLRLQNNATGSLDIAGDSREYAMKLKDRVYQGLKKAGRLPLSLTLRIHLGYCLLRSYPQGKETYGYREFNVMMKNPRASTWLKTSIGDETLATRVLNFIRHDPKSPFQSTSNQTGSPASVLPEYAFEMCSQRMKFEVPIKRKIIKGSASSSVICQLYRVTACELDANIAELDIMNLSVGKNLDWKLEGVTEEKGAKTFPDVVKYLRTANIELKNLNRPHDLGVYPRVKLEPFNSVAAKIKDVAMKTVYHFRWKTTSYIVQIAVNHRWKGVSAMTAEKVPAIDLGITVFGEDWDAEDDAAGNIWGGELQFLLESGEGGMTSNGIERVGHLLRTITDIRNTLGPLF
ncbi:hypothetical protein F4804DRAFT_203344 [Jackrogersella minutella]|nr:hypothetical protein F4804DRAFT_203344 [Jackrogersella minutella]